MRVGGATAGRRAKSSTSRRVTDGREQRLAGGHDPHGVHEILAADVLEEEAAGPGPQRVEDVLVEVEGREDDDLHRIVARRLRRCAGSPRCRRAGHADVHEHDVGRCGAGDVDRLDAVGRLADHVEVGLRVEDHREAAAHELLVVGHDHPHGRRAVGAVRHGPSGSRARTGNPPPALGPASSVPPSTPTRSRIPTSPCPVGPASATGGPSSETVDEQRVVVDGDIDLGPVAPARVAQHVGQRLLDDPVGR